MKQKGTKEKRIKKQIPVFEGVLLSDEVRELKSKIFDMERELFEAKAFEKIASDKLSHWVEKHDLLLVKYKELLKNNEPKA